MSAKRALDVALALAALLATAPLLLLVAVAVRLDSPGPALFRQVRVGRGGRPFAMLKFRSMVQGAERLGGPLTVAGDARVTRVGRVLRELKLDELPQLLNVLAGQMSLVGPRPEVPRYVALYTPAQRRVLELLPGLTDPASLAYFDEAHLLASFADPEQAYVSRVMPHKIELNLAYAARASAPADLRVLLRTLARLVRP